VGVLAAPYSYLHASFRTCVSTLELAYCIRLTIHFQFECSLSGYTYGGGQAFALHLLACLLGTHFLTIKDN